jgi:hypothetical protein
LAATLRPSLVELTVSAERSILRGDTLTAAAALGSVETSLPACTPLRPMTPVTDPLCLGLDQVITNLGR